MKLLPFYSKLFFCTFWRLKILLLIFVCLFCPKNCAIDFTKTLLTQEWLVVERCPTPRWIAFLMLYRLVHNIRLISMNYFWPEVPTVKLATSLFSKVVSLLVFHSKIVKFATFIRNSPVFYFFARKCQVHYFFIRNC